MLWALREHPHSRQLRETLRTEGANGYDVPLSEPEGRHTHAHFRIGYHWHRCPRRCGNCDRRARFVLPRSVCPFSMLDIISRVRFPRGAEYTSHWRCYLSTRHSLRVAEFGSQLSCNLFSGAPTARWSTHSFFLICVFGLLPIAARSNAEAV